MIPSIYLQHKKDYTKDKKTKFKLKVSLICGVVALLTATFLAIGVCLGSFHETTTSKNVITYVRHHPKNLKKLASSDVFISVKTTHKNHQSRLNSVIQTWYQLARDHTYFFTDGRDSNIEAKVNPGHLVVTQCGDSHSRQDLCCKMGVEFDAFLESNKK